MIDFQSWIDYHDLRAVCSLQLACGTQHKHIIEHNIKQPESYEAKSLNGQAPGNCAMSLSPNNSRLFNQIHLKTETRTTGSMILE